jgi:thermostable 8-oxoguanine DNA glycosylase
MRRLDKLVSEVRAIPEERIRLIKGIIRDLKDKPLDDLIAYKKLLGAMLLTRVRAENVVRILDSIKTYDCRHIGGMLKHSRDWRRKYKQALRLTKRYKELKGNLLPILDCLSPMSAREFLVNWFKGCGVGYKSASFFLSRINHNQELAILDVKVRRWMGVEGKFNYLELEERFQKIAKRCGLKPTELDGIIWSLDRDLDEIPKLRIFTGDIR